MRRVGCESNAPYEELPAPAPVNPVVAPIVLTVFSIDPVTRGDVEIAVRPVRIFGARARGVEVESRAVARKRGAAVVECGVDRAK